MAYCSRCGVELESHVQSCPLCDFPVPNELVKIEDVPTAYPAAVNAYENETQIIRNKIFYTYFMVSIAGIAIAMVLDRLYNLRPPVQMMLQYGVLILIASDVMLFFLLGYVKNITRMLLGLGITSLILCYALDAVNPPLTWSMTYATPIIIATTIIFIAVTILYKKSAHTNHFIFIPIYICVALSLLLPIIEGVISFNLRQGLKLSWSIIAMISLLGFSGILSGLYFKLPDYIKERLIRLFHV